MISGREIEDYLYSSDDFNQLLSLLNQNNSNNSIFTQIFQDTHRNILMSASKCNCPQICSTIIDNYPNTLQTINNKKNNSLHYAVFHSNLNIVKLLCKNNINILQKNSYNEYPFDTASIIGRTDLEHIILSNFLYNSQQFQFQFQFQHQLQLQQLPSEMNFSHCQRFKDGSISQIELQPIKNTQFIQQQNKDLWLSSSQSFNSTNSNSNGTFSADTHLSYLTEKFQKVDLQTHNHNHSLNLNTSVDGNSLTSLSNLRNHSLIVLENVNGGTETIGEVFDVFVSTKVTIGRSSTNTIKLKDLSISKSHLEMTFFEGMGLCVVDCGSTHGTTIDDIPLSSSKKSTSSSRSMIIINNSSSVIVLGRVKLGFQKKVTSNTFSKQLIPPSLSSSFLITQSLTITDLFDRFQPNKEMGQQLYEATRMKHLLQSNALQKPQKPSQSVFYLDPLLASRNIFLPPIESWNQNLLNNNDKDNDNDEKDNDEKEKEKRSGETIDSESFIGRSLLVKMGWENGMKLGKTGGVANEPIQVVNKQDKAGIGITSTTNSTALIEERSESRKRKNEGSHSKQQQDVMNVTRMRYYNSNM